MDDTSLISETDSGIEVNISNGIGTSNNNIIYIRFSVPVLNIEKCLQLNVNDSAWIAKQHVLTSLNQDLPESFNYGLYCPPANGRAGKFLDEERPLKDYPFSGPVGFIEFKYKQRLYKEVFSARQLKQIHSESSVRMLIDAIRKNDVEKVSKLTNKGLDPNFIDLESGETPITLAVELPSPKQMMLALVEGGSHLDFRNSRGRTSVHRAAELGNSTALQALLDFGMSTNYKDADGLTPLYVCVVNGCDSTSERCVEILLYDHALVGMTDRGGCTELHQACKTGRQRIIDQLIYYGADVNSRNYIGNTPLHMCAVFDQVECARLLMFRGADRSARNSAGDTAFDLATNIGNLQLANTIEHFSPNEVVLYRDMPVYNEKRRSLWLPSTVKTSFSSDSRSNSISGSSTTIRRTSRHEVASCSSGSQHQPDGSESVKSSTKAPSNWSLAESEMGSRKETVQCNSRQRSVVLQTTEGDSDFGFVLKAVNAFLVDTCPSKHQIAVIHEPSPAQRAGLQPGDFLIEVNGVDVTSSSPDDVMNLISTFDTVITMSVTSHVTVMTNNQQVSLESLPLTTYHLTGASVASTRQSTQNSDTNRFTGNQILTSFETTRKSPFMSMGRSTIPPDWSDDLGRSKVASIRSVHGKRMTTSIPLEELFASTRTMSSKTDSTCDVMTLRSRQARNALRFIHSNTDENFDVQPTGKSVRECNSATVCEEVTNRLLRSKFVDDVMQRECSQEPELASMNEGYSNDAVPSIRNSGSIYRRIEAVEHSSTVPGPSKEKSGESLPRDTVSLHQSTARDTLDQFSFEATDKHRLLPPSLAVPEGRRTLSAAERLQCRPLPPQRRVKSKILDTSGSPQKVVDRESLHLLRDGDSSFRFRSSIFSESDKAPPGANDNNKNVAIPSTLSVEQDLTKQRQKELPSESIRSDMISGVVEAAGLHDASMVNSTTNSRRYPDDGRHSRINGDSNNGWSGGDENENEVFSRGTAKVDGTPDVVKHRSMRNWHQTSFADSSGLNTTNGFVRNEYQNPMGVSFARQVDEQLAQQHNIARRIPFEMNYGYLAATTHESPTSRIGPFDANVTDEDPIIPPPVGFHDNEFPPPPPDFPSSDTSWLPQPPYHSGFAVNHHKTFSERNLMTKIASMEGFRI